MSGTWDYRRDAIGDNHCQRGDARLDRLPALPPSAGADVEMLIALLRMLVDVGRVIMIVRMIVVMLVVVRMLVLIRCGYGRRWGPGTGFGDLVPKSPDLLLHRTLGQGVRMRNPHRSRGQ